MSTLDCWSAPPERLPRTPLVGTPIAGCPEARVGEKLLAPSRERPCTSAKLARAIWPTAAVFPLLKDPEIVPSAPMLKFTNVPLAQPSCWMGAVLLAAASCVSSGTLFLSYRSQVKASRLAPSAKLPGGVGGIVTAGTGGIAIAAGLVAGVTRAPLPSKVNVPGASTTGAAVAAPPRSAAGIVTE